MCGYCLVEVPLLSCLLLRGVCGDCADHDMIYLEPFKGSKEIRGYFEKVVSIVPSDLKFTVEDVTDGDPAKVGVKW